MRRNLVLATVFVVSASAAGASAGWLYFDWLPPGRALPGATIDGRMQPKTESLGDWLEKRRVELTDREAYLVLPEGEGTVKTTLSNLGVEVDVAATMRAVAKSSENGSIGARLYRAMKARKGEVEIPLEWSFDPERAKATLEKLAPDVWRDPVDARLDLVGHQKISDVPGRELDIEATVTMIRDGERDDLATFVIATKPVAAQVTTQMLAEVDVDKVLSAFETDFGGTGKGRAVNIGTAARYLNGTVIAPGQTVSFNEIVGPRNLDRGFVFAPVIKDDELEPGVGGGTCQVASTVHAAAVFGAMEIVQRRSHSRPSGYAPLGLDATVVWGEVDLKLKNPYPTPLIVHAFNPSPTKIRVEFLGREPPGKVEHTYAVVKTHDFYRRVWTKPFVKPGKTVKHQRGIKGYDVVSLVRVTKPDGSKDERHYLSMYRPVPEVFWVAPGADLGELPELPQGAERVEIDGVAVSGTIPSDDKPPPDDDGPRGG